MRIVGLRFLTGASRALAMTAGVMVLLALQPESAKLVDVAAARVPAAAPRTLVLSKQARRFLTLQYRSYPTEFLGCMIGPVCRGRVRSQPTGQAEGHPAR